MLKETFNCSVFNVKVSNLNSEFSIRLCNQINMHNIVDVESTGDDTSPPRSRERWDPIARDWPLISFLQKDV